MRIVLAAQIAPLVIDARLERAAVPPVVSRGGIRQHAAAGRVDVSLVLIHDAGIGPADAPPPPDRTELERRPAVKELPLNVDSAEDNWLRQRVEDPVGLRKVDAKKSRIRIGAGHQRHIRRRLVDSRRAALEVFEIRRLAWSRDRLDRLAGHAGDVRALIASIRIDVEVEMRPADAVEGVAVVKAAAATDEHLPEKSCGSAHDGGGGGGSHMLIDGCSRPPAMNDS